VGRVQEGQDPEVAGTLQDVTRAEAQAIQAKGILHLADRSRQLRHIQGSLVVADWPELWVACQLQVVIIHHQDVGWCEAHA